MNIPNAIMILLKNSRRFLLVFCCLLTLTLGWQANFLAHNHTAIAGTLQSHYPLLADLETSGLKNQVEGRAQQDIGKVESAMDEVGDSLEQGVEEVQEKVESTSKQVKGRAQQDIGKVQSAMDEAGDTLEKGVERAKDKAEAKSKQIKGRAQQDIGKTQEAIQETSNSVEDTTDNVLDAVKNFFLGS